MNPIPEHIAIIMDGNGRWAKERGIPREEGHRRGVEAVDEVVETCLGMGVKNLTLYAFSDENWHRPSSEISALMELLSMYVKSKCGKMLANGIRLRTIGDLNRLPDKARQDVEEVKEATSSMNRMNLILALSYGSQMEMARAFGRLASMGKKEVTPADISMALDTADYPDPDLLIRTSGECRISNFLLWQIAYTELYFTDVLWPDFNGAELKKAVEDYKGRHRRFGRVAEGDEC